jgi:hypothetical protein
MVRAWKRKLLVLAIVLAILMAGYSSFYRWFLDGERYLAMALDAADHDPAIINADEPDFAVGFHNGRLTIHFVFQTQEERGVGSISLHIDPFRQTYFDVRRSSHYRGLDGH